MSLGLGKNKKGKFQVKIYIGKFLLRTLKPMLRPQKFTNTGLVVWVSGAKMSKSHQYLRSPQLLITALSSKFLLT